MSFWIEGWIEVNRPGSPEEQAWQNIISIGSLVDVADEVSERLFGLHQRCVSGKCPVAAVAAERGVPSNHSIAVRAELVDIAEHERRYGAGGIGGYTHMTWREVKASDLDPTVVAASQWSLVFDLVRRLEQDTRFPDDRIRFVVWYIW